MISENKKEYRILLIIVVIATLLGLFISQHGNNLIIREAANKITLPEADFVVKTDLGQLTVGKTTWDEMLQVFPRGENPGSSTVYHPAGQPLYLTFTKKEKILTSIYIQGGSLSTARGIKIGDSLDQMLAAYGNDCRSVSTGEAGTMDLTFGQGNSIVFQIRNNQINGIVLQHTAI